MCPWRAALPSAAAAAARLALGGRSCTRRSSSAALRLGELQLKSDVLLAPLERVSNVGFRRLCFRHGAALTWTEMVYASDLARGKAAAGDLIDTHDPSTLTGAQILVDRTTARDGWGVDCLRAALEALEAGAAGARPEWRNIRAIDLNFGCPDPAVSARGAGPAQLRRRSKVQAIFAALADWRERTSLPIGAIGAKIRLGNTAREQQYQVYLPVAEAAAGSLDYLVVHAIPAPTLTLTLTFTLTLTLTFTLTFTLTCSLVHP